MAYERYRCPTCGTTIDAEPYDRVEWAYPPGVLPNSSNYGMVAVVVRPGAVFCHNEDHPRPKGRAPKPIAMRREAVE